jgi:dipeptidyl aminopeptidase/acylaminoacyl peptidase
MVSVIEQLKYIQAPILIHHGTNDTSVPYSWGVALDEYLRTAGKRVTFHTYQGDNHDIAGHFGQALNRDVAFFSSSN